jgi:hypothetical protein
VSGREYALDTVGSIGLEIRAESYQSIAMYEDICNRPARGPFKAIIQDRGTYPAAIAFGNSQMHLSRDSFLEEAT